MRAFFPRNLFPRNRKTSKAFSRFRTRKLLVEQMEARKMMAADVEADLETTREHRF